MTTHHDRNEPEPGGPATIENDAATPREAASQDARPVGLITLAGTEMWERFSFYGLQVLLAYYLYYSLTDGGLGLPQPIALGIAGSYGGLLYIAQIVGAWIADRVLASRTVVLIGGIGIMAGHIVIAIVPHLAGLICGLVLIVLGTGGLKVNTTTMVGALYPAGGPKRDAGYSIFYMGITVGSFLGPLLTGVLHENWGFHAAFGAAAVGMAFGLVQYAIGMRKLPPSTATVPNPLPASARLRWVLIAGVGVAAIAGLVIGGAVRVDNISTAVSVVVVGAAVTYFVVLLNNRNVTPEERHSVLRYIPVFGMSLVFWTILFQLFTAFAIFADTKVDLSFAGITVSPTLIVTFESLFVAVITALLALIWSRSQRTKLTPVAKVVVGVAVMALGAAAIVPFSIADGASMPLLIAFAVMLVFALGESLFVPAVLSATSGLAPRAANSQMTALYFLTVGGGSTLAGRISQSYQTGAEATYFGLVALIGLASIAVLALVYRVVDRTLGRVN